MAEEKDIETIECSDNESNGQPEHNTTDKPLMHLFDRLIGNDNKQNTVLTNAQIVEILQNEFDIDIFNLHELEVDIYLNIMKKFLKDWPEWDELDKILKKETGNHKTLHDIIQVKHKNLKEYLRLMINTSKPMAKEAVDNAIKETAGIVRKMHIDTSGIVMEIECTRPQLNELVSRRPMKQNNTIFNVSNTVPSMVIVNMLRLTAMVSWLNVSMAVNLKGLQFKREVTQNLKHVLVNKVLQEYCADLNELDPDLEIKVNNKVSTYHSKNKFFKYLDRIIDVISKKPCYNQRLEEFEEIFGIIKSDFQHFTDVIRVPATYRRYTNKYKYVRYLYKDTAEQEVPKKYDLQLKETLSPQIIYTIGKFEPNNIEVPQDSDWLTIECLTCPQKFNLNTICFMENHFKLHQSDTHWKCTNCEEKFSMISLATQKWSHECS